MSLTVCTHVHFCVTYCFTKLSNVLLSCIVYTLYCLLVTMVTVIINHHSYLYPNGQPNNLDLRPLLSVTHEEHLQVGGQ